MSRSGDDEVANIYDQVISYERKKIADANHDEKQLISKTNHATAIADANNKTFLSRAFVVCVVLVTLFAGVTTWKHEDSKVREVAVSLIGLPVGAIAGLLGGMGLR